MSVQSSLLITTKYPASPSNPTWNPVIFLRIPAVIMVLLHLAKVIPVMPPKCVFHIEMRQWDIHVCPDVLSVKLQAIGCPLEPMFAFHPPRRNPSAWKSAAVEMMVGLSIVNQYLASLTPNALSGIEGLIMRLGFILNAIFAVVSRERSLVQRNSVRFQVGDSSFLFSGEFTLFIFRHIWPWLYELTMQLSPTLCPGMWKKRKYLPFCVYRQMCRTTWYWDRVWSMRTASAM